MPDLNPIYAECAMNVDRPFTDRLALYGVNSDLFWKGPAAFGRARIEVINGQSFQFNEDGKEAIIVPACYDYEYCGFEETSVDLIACFLDHPTRFFTLLSNEPILNPAAIEKAEPCLGTDEVLLIHETPLEWLQAGMKGVVILDWRANLPFHLGGVRRIYAANAILAKRIEKALTSPTWPTPEIRFREPKHAA